MLALRRTPLSPLLPQSENVASLLSLRRSRAQTLSRSQTHPPQFGFSAYFCVFTLSLFFLSTTVARLPYIAYPATFPHPRLYAPRSPPYTACEAILPLHLRFHPLLRQLAVSCLLASVILSITQAQKSPQKQAEKPSEKTSTPAEPETPAQIELLETGYRFEADGDSRKEVHTRVKINSELGVRQFARLNFDYNRSFESIDLPLVRITHPSGGTVDILPSAITDNPNPAVINAPAYHDVRVKSVRILGLAPGDLLEYRVITTVSHHPLAPDFWLDHSFDRSGVVSEEHFDIDVPAPRQVQIHIHPATPAKSNEKSGEGDSARSIYRWEQKNSSPLTQDSSSEASSETPASPDVALSTFGHWRTLSMKLADALTPGAIASDPQKSREEQWKELLAAPRVPEVVSQKAKKLTTSADSDSQKTEAIYDFVSTKIATIDLPLGATGFSVRTADAIL